MKVILKVSAFLFSILLMSSSSFAQVKDFNQCVLHNLVGQFEASYGNRDSYTLPATEFFYTAGDSTSVASKVIFVPGWQSYSDQTGVTTSGYQYEEIKQMNAVGTLRRDDAGINVFYAVRGGMVEDIDHKKDVAVGLTVASGIPYLTADKRIETKCSVDAYGRNHCEPPQISYSNFKVMVPKDYQPVVTWKNSQTGLDTQFKLNVEKYLNCLSSIR